MQKKLYLCAGFYKKHAKSDGFFEVERLYEVRKMG